MQFAMSAHFQQKKRILPDKNALTTRYASAGHLALKGETKKPSMLMALR
jgi:hypothetical protein